MTIYTLTTNADAREGSPGADIFRGPAGGNDILRGYGGNDLFEIQRGQYGLINGGADYDHLRLVGTTYNELDARLKIVGVEKLTINASNLYATVDQLDSIVKYDINNTSEQFYFFLKGKGGTLNFSTSYTEPQKLNVEAELATSAVQITGSARADQVIGSDFADTLNGFNGDDRIYGGAGGDTLNGGKGKDVLYGDDGTDTFRFDTPLSANNVDRIGDFRFRDDRITLDDAVFKWDGQHTGRISASEFKIVGNGQQTDSNDHVIYNENTGALYYDVDGRGGKAPVKFAMLDNYSGDIPILTYQDIFIV